MLVSKWKGRYRLHESLLLLWYSRKATALGDESYLFHPLARWRTIWRSFGILLLILHVVSAAASAYVVVRCNADALCDRRCPSLSEWLEGSHAEKAKELLVGTWPAWTGLHYILPPPGAGIAYGCRRALLSEASSMGVRAFAAAEIVFGLLTAASVDYRREGSRARRGSHLLVIPLNAYGTSDGTAARLLLCLDLLLLVSPWRVLAHDADAAATSRLHAVPLPKSGGDPNVVSTAGCEFLEGLPGLTAPVWLINVCRDTRRAWRDNNIIRTVHGWKRLNSLPQAPRPIQAVIDYTIEWMLPTQSEKIAALPTIGDVLLEGEVWQAFVLNFLTSAKVIGLVMSAYKAARVRRGALALRRDRAARKIVGLFRRAQVAGQVSRLCQRHAWSTLMSDAAGTLGGLNGRDQAFATGGPGAAYEDLLVLGGSSPIAARGHLPDLRSSPAELHTLRHRRMRSPDLE